MFVIIILLNNNYTMGSNGALTIMTYTGQVIVSRVIWESSSELFLKPAKDPVATSHRNDASLLFSPLDVFKEALARCWETSQAAQSTI